MQTHKHKNFQDIDVVEVVSNHGLVTVQNIEFFKVGSIVPFAGSSPDLDFVLKTMDKGSLCPCNFRTMMEIVMPRVSLIANERAETLLFIGSTVICNGKKFTPSIQEAYDVRRNFGKKVLIRTFVPTLIPQYEAFSKLWTKKIAVYH